ncbi:histidinol-phosphate transaminase [Shewanella surugensis]|uniref:Histidinol-phosphate aminotransferase n=1 Tax=Shewanella surugensis TaxID=212020 RepID=A0ABT0LB35_9GAMM|nr:histidinol-phosphate transaminase [Shewanella surugensis]MCL1124882.1 histidinol-phosphate transaminase [Shewanella surugensis]
MTALNSLNLAQRLARPELLDLEVYQSARRLGGQGDIWINANESPFNNSDIDNINRYPECQPPALLRAYSQYAGIDKTQLIASRGADEAIELLIRTFCVPAQDNIAIFGPTYGMYAISARTFNVGVKALSLTTDYNLPQDYLSQIKDQASLGITKLVFICNPNNPTGTIIEKPRLIEIIKSLPDCLVVVDEAYIEFCPQYSVCDLLDTYPNLVVLRTLSKAFSLAGARCGFLLANSNIIDMVMRVIAPYPISEPVNQIATKALTPLSLIMMQQQVDELLNQGGRLTQALKQYGATVLPANGNYVLAKFDNIDAITAQLKTAGIVARAYSDPRLSRFIRFSFTNEAQTNRLVAFLSQAKNSE